MIYEITCWRVHGSDCQYLKKDHRNKHFAFAVLTSIFMVLLKQLVNQNQLKQLQFSLATCKRKKQNSLWWEVNKARQSKIAFYSCGGNVVVLYLVTCNCLIRWIRWRRINVMKSNTQLDFIFSSLPTLFEVPTEFGTECSFPYWVWLLYIWQIFILLSMFQLELQWMGPFFSWLDSCCQTI